MSESIFSLLPSAPTKERRAKKYRSKHNPKAGIDSTFNIKNKAAGTMGRTDHRKTTDQFTRSRRDKGVIPSKNGKLSGNAIINALHEIECFICISLTNGYCFCCILVKRFNRPQRVPKRQKVPLRNEKPVMGLKTTKDFLVANAVENILAGETRLHGSITWHFS